MLADFAQRSVAVPASALENVAFHMLDGDFGRALSKEHGGTDDANYGDANEDADRDD